MQGSRLKGPQWHNKWQGRAKKNPLFTFWNHWNLFWVRSSCILHELTCSRYNMTIVVFLLKLQTTFSVSTFAGKYTGASMLNKFINIRNTHLLYSSCTAFRVLYILHELAIHVLKKLWNYYFFILFYFFFFFCFFEWIQYEKYIVTSSNMPMFSEMVLVITE